VRSARLWNIFASRNRRFYDALVEAELASGRESNLLADEDVVILRAAADARIVLHTIVTGGIPAIFPVGSVSASAASFNRTRRGRQAPARRWISFRGWR
jgi:hypothetical protein